MLPVGEGVLGYAFIGERIIIVTDFQMPNFVNFTHVQVRKKIAVTLVKTNAPNEECNPEIFTVFLFSPAKLLIFVRSSQFILT